jgi:hypothetical protein
MTGGVLRAVAGAKSTIVAVLPTVRVVHPSSCEGRVREPDVERHTERCSLRTGKDGR